MNYQELLDKYNTPFVPGEKRSREYERETKREQRLKKRFILLDLILNDAKTLLVTPNQKKQVKYLIKQNSNQFKELHGNASESTIILAFIFFVKMMDDINIKLDRYSISKKYNLNHNNYETIICRLAKQYMGARPIQVETTTNYDHEILMNTKGQTRTK